MMTRYTGYVMIEITSRPPKLLLSLYNTNKKTPSFIKIHQYLYTPHKDQCCSSYFISLINYSCIMPKIKSAFYISLNLLAFRYISQAISALFTDSVHLSLVSTLGFSDKPTCILYTQYSHLMILWPSL